MKKKIILSIIGILIIVIGFVAWTLFGPTVKQPEIKYFFIATGENYKGVRAGLHDQKIISSEKMFDIAAKVVGYKKIKPGRYEFKKGMSLVKLVRMLNNGQQSPINFVIIKKRTREGMAAQIGAAFEPDSLEVIRFLNNTDSLKQYGLDTNTVMAAAMPLTYTIKWNTIPAKIFLQFYTAWQTFWTDERKKKAEDLQLTPVQVSTLASIIDEETNAETDRPYMASVYLNRINKGMPLQADPTLKFALKNFGLKRILNEHKTVESPYNTYVNKGLPPGPICTPATATIDAVLNSPTTDYLYFVANSDFSGTHIFTTNYEDHMKYARIYQQELNKRNIK